MLILRLPIEFINQSFIKIKNIKTQSMLLNFKSNIDKSMNQTHGLLVELVTTKLSFIIHLVVQFLICFL